MQDSNTAAIYVRISRDRVGAGLGVDRQEADCRALADRYGLTIQHVLVDNDLSAYSGKRRPGYEQLLQLIRTGAVQTVLAWHTDRLHRSPSQLEEFITACEIHSTDVLTVQAGAIDLSTASGRMGARIYGAVARHEVEHAIERQKAAKLQAAKAGKWSGGPRPYGYLDGCKGINEPEAAVVRELVERVIDGASFYSLALDLNARRIRTGNGSRWNALKIRNLLSHARYAGIREHNGAEYPAEWPAILDMDTWEDLQLAIRQHANRYTQRGPMRKFLLSGFAYCGRCGKRMNTAPRNTYTRYVCRARDEHGAINGCGGILRRTDPVDLLVSECIIYRLESSEFDAMLDGSKRNTDELRTLMQRQHAQADRLQEIRDDYASGELTKAEYQNMLPVAQLKLDELTRAIEKIHVSHGVRGVTAGHKAREAWDAADLQQRREIVRLLIERVTVLPSNTSRMTKADYWRGFKFRCDDIRIEWRA